MQQQYKIYTNATERRVVGASNAHARELLKAQKARALFTNNKHQRKENTAFVDSNLGESFSGRG